MKDIPSYIRFERGGEEKIGMSLGGKFFTLPYKSMQECIASNFNSDDGVEIGHGGGGIEQGDLSKNINIKAPIIPSKIVCMGWNYKKHAKELMHEYEKPVIFLKPPSAVIGHRENIVIPKISNRVEHEVELGIVIGRVCKDVTKNDAADYVAGYTIILDITARDLQFDAMEKGRPWSVCKGLDTFAPMGPGIIPGEFIENPNDLDIELRVNGELRQKSNTKNMITRIEDIVSHASDFMTLHRGDLIATGTPAGVGPLKAGDVIKAGIENIGVLENYVVEIM